MRPVRLLISLQFQITIAISLMVITAVILMGLLVTYLSRTSIEDEKRRLIHIGASMIQRSLSQPTKAERAAGPKGKKQLINRVTMLFFDRRYHHSITFFDEGNNIFYSTLPSDQWPYAKVFYSPVNLPSRSIQIRRMEDPASDEPMLVYRFPWVIDGIQEGYVQLVAPLITPIQEFLFSGKLIVAFAIGYALLIIIFGVILLKQTVVNPVQEINQAVRRMIAGERNITLPEGEKNELGQLAQSFNEAATQLALNEQRQSEQIEELLKVNEELELTKRGLIRSEKLASIGRLAAGIAHEVGNPLSAIMGYVELLHAGGLDEEVEKDFLSRIEKDITRISAIIRGLLEYSRPKRERIEQLDMNKIIDDTIVLLKPQKQFKYMTFDFFSHQRPAWINADRNQLQQVLVNLLINASHAMTGKGSISIFLEKMVFDPSVTYRQSADKFRSGDSLVTVSVIDQGIGISEEIQEHVFDPFFTTKEPGSGTGLGLSVSYKIIDSFCGNLTVSSKSDQGATFTILLPEAAPAVHHPRNTPSITLKLD